MARDARCESESEVDLLARYFFSPNTRLFGWKGTLSFTVSIHFPLMTASPYSLENSDDRYDSPPSPKSPNSPPCLLPSQPNRHPSNSRAPPPHPTQHSAL